MGAGMLPVLAHIPAAVTIVQGSPSPNTLVEQSKALYDAGKFSEAAAVLQQAVATFKTQGDVLKTAMTLSNLSLTYQQLGLWSEAQQAIADSLKLLQSGENVSNLPKGGTSERSAASSSATLSQILAQTLDIQGRLQLSLGQPEQALKTWQQAAITYAQIGKKDEITQNQINQAQALQNMGLYPRACKTLLEALGINNQDCKISDQQLQTLKDQPDSLTKAIGLRSLGDILQLVGDLKQSEEVLRQSLDVAQRLQSPPEISAALFSLGNTVRAQGNTNTDKTRRIENDALKFYQQAAEVSTSPTTRIQAQLNQLSLLLETKEAKKLSEAQVSEAQALWPQIRSQLANLPPNRAGVYARINLAQSLMKLSTSETNVPSLPREGLGGVNEAAQLLATAVQQAKDLGDQRASA